MFTRLRKQWCRPYEMLIAQCVFWCIGFSFLAFRHNNILLTTITFKSFQDYFVKFKDFKALNLVQSNSRLFKTFKAPYRPCLRLSNNINFICGMLTYAIQVQGFQGKKSNFYFHNFLCLRFLWVLWFINKLFTICISCNCCKCQKQSKPNLLLHSHGAAQSHSGTGTDCTEHRQ